jgi:lipopolysaccharide/colanic/teichoic acid biosynthesis glycosyltransferase
MQGLSATQAFAKRSFDVVLACIGLLLTGWLILLAWLLATIDTRSNGLFMQERVGRHGKPFTLVKIRTMRPVAGEGTHVTTATDPRITRLGRFLRATKIDELPQLVNVLTGSMSFVGPRPDVPGFADRLAGDDRIILAVRPGITGPATLKYRHEEQLLAGQADPESYNRDVIYPDKVHINKEYVRNWSFRGDLAYILRTVAPGQA